MVSTWSPNVDMDDKRSVQVLGLNWCSRFLVRRRCNTATRGNPRSLAYQSIKQSWKHPHKANNFESCNQYLITEKSSRKTERSVAFGLSRGYQLWQARQVLPLDRVSVQPTFTHEFNWHFSLEGKQKSKRIASGATCVLRRRPFRRRREGEWGGWRRRKCRRNSQGRFHIPRPVQGLSGTISQVGKNDNKWSGNLNLREKSLFHRLKAPTIATTPTTPVERFQTMGKILERNAEREASKSCSDSSSSTRSNSQVKTSKTPEYPQGQ